MYCVVVCNEKVIFNIPKEQNLGMYIASVNESASATSDQFPVDFIFKFQILRRY